jgi:hypothetical protein
MKVKNLFNENKKEAIEFKVRTWIKSNMASSTQYFDNLQKAKDFLENKKQSKEFKTGHIYKNITDKPNESVLDGWKQIE